MFFYELTGVNSFGPFQAKKVRFLCPSELIVRSLRSVDQTQNLLGTTTQLWATLSLCFRSIVLIVFTLFCS